MRTSLILVMFGVLCMALPCSADTDIVVAFGFSGPQLDAVDDAVWDDDITAGFGIMLDAGVRYSFNDHVRVTPSIGIIESIYEADSVNMDLIVVARLKGVYQVSKAPSIYFGGEINMNMPSSSSDDYELDSGGMGYTGLIGYEFWSPRSGKFSLELGYQNIPVEVTTAWDGADRQYKDEDNMGGGFLRVLYTF